MDDDEDMPQSRTMGPLTLSYDRTAEVLDVSRSTLKRLVRTGAIPVVEVGGVPRVRAADLENYVARLDRRDAVEGNGQ